MIFENAARNMVSVSLEIWLRHIGNCLKADPAYGEAVAKVLGIPMSKAPKK